MNLIETRAAYYPHFPMGCTPLAVPCHLSIVEANGKRYLRTPFAMLDAHGPDEIERQLQPGRGFYADEAEALAYLAQEYPWWTHAEPIMQALFNARHQSGDLVGPSRVADRCGVSTDALYQLARGHKRFTLKAIRAAVKALAG